MADRVGQQLGSYRLVRKLGSGGSAVVYLGDHIHTGYQAAIKVLDTRLTIEKDIEDFRKEARVLASLEHPHIVRLLEFDIEEGFPFLVMAYAPNGTLRQKFPKKTRFSLETILPYIKQASLALQHAHDHKLIHRDVKPENLLLSTRGEVLLSDFGIAVVAHSTSQQYIQKFAGTATYAAPEQFEDQPRPASDQYALAIIVYEWLSGEWPFQGTPLKIGYQKVNNPAPSLRHKVATLSPVVEQVVLKALATDPHQRFACIQEFATALEQAGKDVRLSLVTGPIILPDTEQKESAEISPKAQKPKEQWLEEADSHLKANRFKEALEACEHAIQIDPNNALAYNMKGVALRNLGRPKEALDAFDQAMRLNPKLVAAYCNKGATLNDNLHRYGEALTLFEQALQLDPNDEFAHTGKGYALIGLQKFVEAVAAFDHSPNSPIAYTGRAYALRALKALAPKRGEVLAQAHQPNLNAGKAHRGDDDLFSAAESFRQGGNIFDRTLPQRYKSVTDYTREGTILLFSKRFAEAQAAYDEAIKLDPKNAGAFNGKGMALEFTGRYPEALQVYEQAIACDPQDGFAWRNKGDVLTNLGKEAEAKEAYREAHERGYWW